MAHSIDEVFESLLHVEENFFTRGRDEGRIQGNKTGFSEGLNLGHKKGFETGNEMGYYLGCVEGWLLLKTAESETGVQISERTYKNLLSLKALILSLNLDPSRERLIQDLEAVRAKFKVISSQLKVNQKFSVQTTESGF